jgi:lipid-A-disaccharide synthase-like uncharacterized protein
MQQFELVLRNEKQKLYDRLAIFIFILNGTGICVALLYFPVNFFNSNSKPFLIGLAAALFMYQLFALFTKRFTRYLHSFLIASLAISLYWALIGFWWIGILTSGIIILYVLSKRDLKVKVEGEKIYYPSFPAKSILWSDLNNLILKDGLLTIDFKNNKIIQQLIDESKTSVDEKKFNEFCNQQLKAAVLSI